MSHGNIENEKTVISNGCPIFLIEYFILPARTIFTTSYKVLMHDRIINILFHLPVSNIKLYIYIYIYIRCGKKFVAFF